MRSTLPAALLGALSWSLSASAVAGTLTTEADGVQIEVRSEPETPVRQTNFPKGILRSIFFRLWPEAPERTRE